MPDTYLELCQQLIRDAGISGTMTTVVSHTGEFKRVTEWIARAVREIEQKFFNWDFLWTAYSFNTVATQQDYTKPADHNFWDESTFSIAADEQKLDFQPYSEIKKDPSMLPANSVAGAPYKFTVLPSKSIRLYDIPNAVVGISCNYYKVAKTLALDADTPNIPAQFRDIIVAKAMMYYAKYESADEILQEAIDTWNELWAQLCASELPDFQASSALNTGVKIDVVAESTLGDYYD